LVEYLFRRSFVKAVLSTTALAVGVNMPAKSVAFLGDHRRVITPIMYKYGASSLLLAIQ